MKKQLWQEVCYQLKNQIHICDCEAKTIENSSGIFNCFGFTNTMLIIDQLSPVWPLDHWDHWMRLSTTHKGRDCIIPEMSRNYNFGFEGSCKMESLAFILV